MIRENIMCVVETDFLTLLGTFCSVGPKFQLQVHFANMERFSALTALRKGEFYLGRRLEVRTICSVYKLKIVGKTSAKYFIMKDFLQQAPRSAVKKLTWPSRLIHTSTESLQVSLYPWLAEKHHTVLKQRITRFSVNVNG